MEKQMQPLPQHRELMIEALRLLLTGNPKAAQLKAKAAKEATNKFYNSQNNTK